MNLHEARESRPVLVSRFGNPVLTDDLGSVWPEVSARLATMLRRRGVRHHDIDEIVQETAARAISSAVTYANADELFRWASVVGGRLAIDVHRRGARLSDDELPDRADTIDVAMAAEHRVVLTAVQRRMPELSAKDQAILLSGVQDEPAANRRESVRIAVARHRARNRLRLLLDGLAGGALLAWVRRRRVWSAPAEAISYVLVPTAACLLITVGGWTGGTHVQPRESASAATLASQPRAVLPSPVATPVAAAPLVAVSEQPPSRVETRPTQRASDGVEIPDAQLSVPSPASEQPARVAVRNRQPSDHLWCLTPPPEVGQPTSCFDSPVPLPSTP